MDSCEEISSDSATAIGTTVSTEKVLPRTKERYDRLYQLFKEWQASRKYTMITQPVVMAYFLELAQTRKPTSLWTSYSMLKSRLRSNENVDIGSYSELTAFIKTKSDGYSPCKATAFSLEDIHKFIDTAPDQEWLDVKVVCIFSVAGTCYLFELPGIRYKDVESHGDVLQVRIRSMDRRAVKAERTFTIAGKFRQVVQKYMALRVPHIQEERFFLNYQRGKCTNQCIGKNKFYKMPRRMAAFLKLPDPESYTGNSFRRTSRTITGNTPPSSIFINGPTATIPSSRQIDTNTYTQSNQMYGSSNSFHTAQHPPSTMSLPPTNHANHPNKKFGEIYCSPSGELS